MENGRILGKNGAWLNPVMNQGYKEATYNLRHGGKCLRIKARTVLSVVWGPDSVKDMEFTPAWCKRIHNINGFTPHRNPEVKKQHVQIPVWAGWDDLGTWNDLRWPGFSDPTTPEICPLEQHMGAPVVL